MFLWILFIFFTGHVYAEETSGLTVVAVGEAEVDSDRLLIASPHFDGPVSTNYKKLAEDSFAVLRNDFSFYRKKFSVLSPEQIGEAAGNNLSKSPDFEFLKKKAIRFFIRGDVIASGGVPNIYIQLFDVQKKAVVLEKPFPLKNFEQRRLIHELANEVYRQIAGKESIFLAKIIFVSDRTSSRGVIRKEVYSMDFDGKNIQQLTQHGGNVISPDISYSGDKIVYSLIKEGRMNRNIDLYLMDLKTKNFKIVSSRKGINSGAIFLPDDEHLVLTLSHTGNAEIYKLNLKTESLTAITHNFAADVDPSVNREGNLMTFLSDRPGKAMIYTMDPRSSEKNVKRISFVGQFNASPRFSPDGKEIVFASWLDERFDIFRINSDGQGLSRLTKDFGSNEDPSYSPDGEFIIFSSQRVLSRKHAIVDIYIMDRDGEILGPLTHNFGNCISPRWSK